MHYFRFASCVELVSMGFWKVLDARVVEFCPSRSPFRSWLPSDFRKQLTSLSSMLKRPCNTHDWQILLHRITFQHFFRTERFLLITVMISFKCLQEAVDELLQHAYVPENVWNSFWKAFFVPQASIYKNEHSNLMTILNFHKHLQEAVDEPSGMMTHSNMLKFLVPCTV